MRKEMRASRRMRGKGTEGGREYTHDKVNNRLLDISIPDTSVGALFRVKPSIGVLISGDRAQLHRQNRLLVDGYVWLAWESAYKERLAVESCLPRSAESEDASWEAKYQLSRRS